jgi:hypothetical protein
MIHRDQMQIGSPEPVFNSRGDFDRSSFEQRLGSNGIASSEALEMEFLEKVASMSDHEALFEHFILTKIFELTADD